jgi:hypothetical protein
VSGRGECVRVMLLEKLYLLLSEDYFGLFEHLELPYSDHTLFVRVI